MFHMHNSHFLRYLKNLSIMPLSVFLVFFLCQFNLGHVKRKSALEHAQNVQVQIILGRHKVSSRPLLSRHTSVVYSDFVSGL